MVSVTPFPKDREALNHHQVGKRILIMAVQEIEDILALERATPADERRLETLLGWLPFSYIATLAAMGLEDEDQG